MHRIRIGGVPEHFNMPWYIGINNGLFQAEGIDIEWTDFPSGTGAMVKALENNELDIAIMLTEGTVSAIKHGAEICIINWYITTPLVWGIHVASHASIYDLSDIFRRKYAISRLGSGSHLMAKVHAQILCKSISDSQWKIVNNLSGAVEALTKGEADVFFWEKFTSMPWVDKGVFRRIGEFPTPWPCFVIASRVDYLQNNKSIINTLQKVLHGITQNIKSIRELDFAIATRYQLPENQVLEWLKTVEWQTKPNFNPDELSIVERYLA